MESISFLNWSFVNIIDEFIRIIKSLDNIDLYSVLCNLQLGYRKRWTRDPLSGTRDPGPQNFQVEPETWDPWSGTLMNNLLAWKFECCNKSIDILLEN